MHVYGDILPHKRPLTYTHTHTHTRARCQFSDFVNGIQISRLDSEVRVQNHIYLKSYSQIAWNRERCKMNETSFASAGLWLNFSPVSYSTHSYFTLQSVNVIFGLYYSVNTGVDSVYDIYEHQEYFLEVEAADAYIHIHIRSSNFNQQLLKKYWTRQHNLTLSTLPEWSTTLLVHNNRN
jgi:hypothetical protein